MHMGGGGGRGTIICGRRPPTSSNETFLVYIVNFKGL